MFSEVWVCCDLAELDLVQHAPRLDKYGGVSANNRPGWYVVHDDSPRGYDRPGTNGDMRADECVGADPGVVLDLNLRTNQRHFSTGVIVRAGAQVRSLRNCHISADRHGAKIVDQRIFADRRVITYGQLPGKGNADCIVDMHLRTDTRPEHT